MELTADAHGKVTLLCQAADNHLGAGEIDAALTALVEALDLLPPPVDQWEAATWVFGAIADAHFERGDFAAVREAAARAIRCPGGLGNPFLHLRLGQAQYELGDTERAKDELARAYMGGGDSIFEGDDPKYWRFIREILRPPREDVGQ